MTVLAHSESTALTAREPAVTDLGPLGRALAWSRRPGAWLLFRLPRPLLALIGRKRLVPIEGRTIDVQIAAMLAIDDLFHESDLRRLSPAAARRRTQVSIAALELSTATRAPNDRRTARGAGVLAALSAVRPARNRGAIAAGSVHSRRRLGDGLPRHARRALPLHRRRRARSRTLGRLSACAGVSVSRCTR